MRAWRPGRRSRARLRRAITGVLLFSLVIPGSAAALVPSEPNAPTPTTAIASESSSPAPVSATLTGMPWAWGWNGSGQIGNATTTQQNSPVRVSNLTGITTVTAGDSHSLAIQDDGALWSWGENFDGQLGIGTSGTGTNKSVPTQVTALSGVIAIAGGGFHSLAVKSDGTVWAWGWNVYGQLGNNSTVSSSTPVQVSGLSSVTGVAAGRRHSFALKSDGTVWAWGDNSDGQLGDGTSANQKTIPVQVVGAGGAGFLTSVRAIAAGDFYGIVAKTDGTVWTWGANGLGQLGLATTRPLQLRRRSRRCRASPPSPRGAATALRSRTTAPCGPGATASTGSSATATRSPARV